TRSRHNGDRSGSWLGDLAPGSPGPLQRLRLAAFSLVFRVAGEEERGPSQAPGYPVGPGRSSVVALVGRRQLAAIQARHPLDVADEVDGPARAPEITGLDDHIRINSRVAAAHPGTFHRAATQLEGPAADPERPGP